MKVLGGMFGFGGVVLPNSLSSKLAFLKDFGIEFGGWVSHIDSDAGRFLIPSILIGFILILVFKNSNQKLSSFSFNYQTVAFTAVIFVISVLSLTKFSEFLYFNF